MARKEDISSSVIKRLPRYYRFIGELIAEGRTRISSADLAAQMSLTASQIRQDLNCFGGFGQPGCGYYLPDLHSEIGRILGLDRHRKAILIGAGNLGRAIAIHMKFESFGMTLCGIFDTDEDKTGLTVAGMKILPMTEIRDFIAEKHPEAAILCIPRESAEECTDLLVSCGIKAFWNFSHYDLTAKHKDIIAENVHLGDSLMLLSYGLNNSESSENES